MVAAWCPRCRAVFVEQLDWLAKNPRYTQRFALHVGKLCRDMPNKAVAEIVGGDVKPQNS